MAIASVVATSGVARAQSVELEASAFRRGNADDGGDGGRTDEADGINRAECARRETWHYEVTTEEYGGETLTVWVGHECDESEKRDDGCEQIGSVSLGSDTKHSQDVELDAADIASASGSGCDDLDDTVRLWFLVLAAAGSEDAAAPESFASSPDIPIDTVPLDPPEDLAASPGETRVTLDWKDDDEEAGFYVACARSDETLDADAGSESCVGDALPAGFVAGADYEPAWRCDASSADAQPLSGTSARIDDLTDGVQARLAVASVDEMGNPSALSAVVCATPQEVDDFFEQYHQAGGRAGGGDCGIAPGPGGLGGPALLGIVGLSALRRRRP